jgi:hypothetical protein
MRLMAKSWAPNETRRIKWLARSTTDGALSSQFHFQFIFNFLETPTTWTLR